MKSKQCAVLFVDILGFSALTKGLIKDIKDADYEAYDLMNEEDRNHVVLAAKILSEFRIVLNDAQKKYPSIHICQLSDCAFVWSENLKSFMPAVHFIMWNMIQVRGILCRGGMSYGDVVEVDTINEFGKTIVGDAATNAARNESKLKGPRITIDVDFPAVFWTAYQDDIFAQCVNPEIFNAITSEVDLSEENEYRWYLFDDDYFSSASGKSLSHEDCIELTKQRLKLSNVLRYHPRIGWNTRNAEGMIHVRAGLKSISKNELLGVLHHMECSVVTDSGRTISRYERANDRIDNDRYFKKSQREAFERYILELD